MIPVFLVTFTVMLLAVGGLAIGLLQNKPLKGSCGGIANMTGDDCSICGGKPELCETDNEK